MIAKNTIATLNALRIQLDLSVNEFVGWFNVQVPVDFQVTVTKYRRWARGESVKVYFTKHRVRLLGWYLGLRYEDMLRGSLQHSSSAKLQTLMLRSAIKHRSSTPNTRMREIPREYRAFAIYAVNVNDRGGLRAHCVVLATSIQHARDLMLSQKPHLSIESVAPLHSVCAVLEM